MLVIVNPYATTVSDRLRNLVVYALQSRYSVEAIDTEKRDHATQITREAAREGYDVVVAFGGDGTVNEAANGLVGSDTPLTALPGGSTNVWARTLGIPNDVVDATEHMLRMADDRAPLRVRRRGRTRRLRRRARGRPPLPEGALRRLVLHLRRGLDLQPPISRQATARAGPGGRPHARGRDRDRPELGSLHVLPQAPDPGDGAGRTRNGVAGRRRAEERHAARAAHADPAAAVEQGRHGAAPPPGGGAGGTGGPAGGGDRRPSFSRTGGR